MNEIDVIHNNVIIFLNTKLILIKKYDKDTDIDSVAIGKILKDMYDNKHV